MVTKYNIGRKLTKRELLKVAEYNNFENVTQDADGNLDHDGQPVTSDQIKTALRLYNDKKRT